MRPPNPQHAAAWLCAALILAACSQPAGPAPAAAPSPAAAAPTPALVYPTATGVIPPTPDAAAPGALETAAAGPEMATAMALAATANAEAAGLLPLSPEEAAQVVGAAGVKRYTWTIMEAPEGARNLQGKVIKQGGDSQIALDADKLDQYFPAEGTYTLRLTIVDGQDQTVEREFSLTM